jgi:hypothetical protein
MYGKPAITGFKYQAYLYGSDAITCLNAMLCLSGYRASTI